MSKTLGNEPNTTMQDPNTNWDTIKKHLIDIGKGFLAAAAMGALQAALAYIAHIDWNHVLAFAMQAVAALAAIKKTA